MEGSHASVINLQVVLADRTHQLTVDSSKTTLNSVMKSLETAFGVNMQEHCLTYIDSDREYIVIKDEDEWQLYLEEYSSSLLCATYKDQLFIFRDNEVLTTRVISDMIDQSLISSFADFGNRTVAEVQMDDEMRSQIASDLAGNSAYMTPALKSQLSFADPQTQLGNPELQDVITKSVKTIIDEKVKAGEIQLSESPLESGITIAPKRSPLLVPSCTECSRLFEATETFYLDGENNSIKLCSGCKDKECFNGKTLFTCVPGVKPAEMSEDGFEVVSRPPVALENSQSTLGSSHPQDYSLPDFPIRLVCTQLKHNQEEHRDKVEQLKRKGVKFFKKKVKVIGKIGKSLFKGVKKLLEG